MEGRRSGAPPEACGIDTDIVPNHGGSPSTNPIRYFVSLIDFKDNEYIAGQNYTSKCVHCEYCKLYVYYCTVRMVGGEDRFKGFMIQGRIVADDSPTGTFAVSGVNYQAQCENNVRHFYSYYSTDDDVVMCLYTDSCYTH